MKNVRRLVLTATAVATLAVTACSAPASSTGSSGGGSASSAPTQETVAFKKYSEAELTGLLQASEKASGETFKILPTADMKKALDAAKSLASATKITPAECGATNLGSSLQMLDGISVATATAGADAQGIPTSSISLISGLDESAMASNMDKSRASLEKCKDVTVEVAGQKAESSNEMIPVQAKTPGVVALKSTTKTSMGTSMTQVVVNGLKGGVGITVVRLNSTDAAADATKAAATLDAVADQIK
ncbi:hypothetical protein [Arthrobacter sp. NPDC090010]|uniref:hypothetical protein n=1 Tax=Arthrobacter sp. NPDC090010 TaxID=3363942 RepID=UPI00382F8A15